MDFETTGKPVRVYTVVHTSGLVVRSQMAMIQKDDVPQAWHSVTNTLGADDWYEYSNQLFLILGDAAFNGETYTPKLVYPSDEAIRLTQKHSKPQIEARIKQAKQAEELARKQEKERIKAAEYQKYVEQQRKEDQDRREHSDTPLGHARRIRELEATVAKLQREMTETEKRLEQKIRDAYLVGAP